MIPIIGNVKNSHINQRFVFLFCFVLVINSFVVVVFIVVLIVLQENDEDFADFYALY